LAVGLVDLAAGADRDRLARVIGRSERREPHAAGRGLGARRARRPRCDRQPRRDRRGREPRHSFLALAAMKPHALSSSSVPAFIAQATASLLEPPLQRRTSPSLSLFLAAASVPSNFCMLTIAARQSSAAGLLHPADAP